MFAVLFAWVAYLALVFMVVTHRIQIAGFLPSIIILAALFFVLFIWSIKKLTSPKKQQVQAAQQAAALRTAANRATVAAADSGSVTFRVAGTTFDNDDGTSRQDILRHLKFGDAPWADDPDDLTAELEETEFNGDPAIEVHVNGYLVGFVPKTHIRQVAAAQQHTATCYVSSVRILGGGTGDDGRDLSYGCEITLEY